MSRIPQIIARVNASVGRVNEASARRIAADARQRVPVLTGDTRDSIKAESSDGDTARVTVGFPGQFIERGTRHMGARPFMVPAAEAERQAHRNAIRDLYK